MTIILQVKINVFLSSSFPKGLGTKVVLRLFKSTTTKVCHDDIVLVRISVHTGSITTILFVALD